MPEKECEGGVGKDRVATLGCTARSNCTLGGNWAPLVHAGSRLVRPGMTAAAKINKGGLGLGDFADYCSRDAISGMGGMEERLVGQQPRECQCPAAGGGAYASLKDNE